MLNTIIILSVDDSSTIRRVYKNLLPQIIENPIQFLEASDGKEALDLLKANPGVHLIFLDVNMPNMKGTDFLAELRKYSNYNTIRVIMSATEAEKSTVMNTMKMGANGYIVKPFNLESVKKMVANVAGRMSDSGIVLKE